MTEVTVEQKARTSQTVTLTFDDMLERTDGPVEEVINCLLFHVDHIKEVVLRERVGGVVDGVIQNFFTPGCCGRARDDGHRKITGWVVNVLHFRRRTLLNKGRPLICGMIKERNIFNCVLTITDGANM